jgi:hypothetical protein
MKKGVDSTLMFWKAFGEFKEGGVTEAIRHLEFIQMKREIQYAATIALIFYHNQCEIVDDARFLRNLTLLGSSGKFIFPSK